MRQEERVDFFAEADYTDKSTANMWIINKIKEIAERIYKTERGAV